MKEISSPVSVGIKVDAEPVVRAPIHNWLIENYPCWFATFKKDASDRTNSYWHVGCVKEGKTSACKVNVSNLGDLNDHSFWLKVQSVDFSISLVDAFRSGGEEKVRLVAQSIKG